MIKVKAIYNDEFWIRGTSKEDVELKLASLLAKCVDNKIDLQKIFNNVPVFEYEIEKMNNTEVVLNCVN